MPSSDVLIQEYLNTVCGQIKVKKVHSNIRKEIACHIEEQKEAYLCEEIDEESATKKAVEEMGDPISVGQQLDKLHRPISEKSIIALTLLLTAVGLLFQFLINDGNSSIGKPLLYVLVGLVALTATYFCDYTLIGKYSKYIFTFFAVSCIALFFIFSRFSRFGEFFYYLSLLFIPVLSGVLYSFRGYGYISIIASGLFYVLFGYFFLSSNSTSAFLQISCAYLIMVSIVIFKRWYSVKRTAALIIAYSPFLLELVFISVSGRLSYFLSMRQSGADTGYIAAKIRELIENANFIGRGTPIHDSALPNASTNYTLTYIIATYGIIAGIAIIILASLLIYRMFLASFRQRTSLGFIVSFSATLAFALQVLVFIMVNLGCVLIPANTMPFLSNSGFGIVVNMILIGLILSAFRNTNLVFEKAVIKKNRRTIFRESGDCK